MSSITETSIQYLKGVGPARAKLFANLGVTTIEDLLYLFPRRYDDRRTVTPIDKLKLGEWQTVIGKVLSTGGRRAYWNKKHVFELTVGDESSRVFCVWFNQPYLDKYFHEGDQVVLYGRPDLFNKRIQMICPEYELLSKEDETLSTGRIVPVYPLTKGISQRYLRRTIHAALSAYAPLVGDVLPPDIRARQGLSAMGDGLFGLHFPSDEKAQAEANRRISFEEFFLFQVSVILRRLAIARKKGVAHRVPEEMVRSFEAAFPFAFTASQRKALAEVRADMEKPRPMLRLLQGDVGSGKTVVAFFGCLAALANGKQAAVMAPTEILAEQHYAAFARYFGDQPRGSRLSARNSRPVRTALLNSALNKKDREAALAAIKAGEVDVVFGTHALIQEDVTFKSLSFVVVDEQHKFGVKQRALLSSKGKSPDMLVMTATPIPRTLCLTLYGDLDVSTLSEKPAGRGEIKTYLFPGDQAPSVYKKVAEWVEKGTQAYIVYPLVEESEKLDLKAAADMYGHLKTGDFREFRVGLIHGRLAREEANAVMAAFKRHEIDILITTTVLEVGIDVPNANVMVIEHAERFGLSQLHQLRGRIGRSGKSAVCILLGEAVTPEGEGRLGAIVKTTDGFTIAEEDLKIRGPGQYFGRHQHGLNELKVVNPLTQMDVLEAARKEAVRVVDKDPKLVHHEVIKATILKRYPEYLERILAG